MSVMYVKKYWAHEPFNIVFNLLWLKFVDLQSRLRQKLEEKVRPKLVSLVVLNMNEWAYKVPSQVSGLT